MLPPLPSHTTSLTDHDRRVTELSFSMASHQILFACVHPARSRPTSLPFPCAHTVRIPRHPCTKHLPQTQKRKNTRTLFLFFAKSLLPHLRPFQSRQRQRRKKKHRDRGKEKKLSRLCCLRTSPGRDRLARLHSRPLPALVSLRFQTRPHRSSAASRPPRWKS